MRGSTQLLDDIQAYCRKELLEGDQITVFAKYHMASREDPNYQETLRTSFECLREEEDFDLTLEMSQHLAYLQQMEPDLDPRLKSVQQYIFQMLDSCLNGNIIIKTARQILGVLGKLASPGQCYDLIASNIENFHPPQRFSTNLAILQQKIQWELKKVDHFLILNWNSSYDLVARLVKHLKAFSQEKHQRILEVKVQLLTKIIVFLQDRRSSLQGQENPQSVLFRRVFGGLKNDLVQLFMDYQKISAQSLSQPDNLFKMVRAYFSLFEVYDDSWMKELLQRNGDSFFNCQFLQMLRCFIVHSKKGKMLSKDKINVVLKKVYHLIFECSGTNPAERYRFIKTCCDLIISIGEVYCIDFTKNVLIMARDRQKTLEGVFLASLLMLYFFKLNEQNVRQLSYSIKDGYNFLQQQTYFKNYQNLLTNYQKQQLKVQEVIMDQIIWELLTLRNTVKINLQNVLFQEGAGITQKLMILTLFNIYPQQSTQIILIIAKTQKGAQLLSQIAISEIIEHVLLMHRQGRMKLTSTQALCCLNSILTSSKGTVTFIDIQSMSLIYSVSRLILTVIGVGQEIDPLFLNQAFTLMDLCLPSPSKQYDAFKMQQAIKAVFALVETNLSSKFFDIYLGLYFKLQLKKISPDFLEELSVVQKYHSGEIRQVRLSCFHRHEIVSLMISKGEVNDQLEAQCWREMQGAIRKGETSFCISITYLFEYFQSQFKSGRFSNQSYQIFLEKHIGMTESLLLLLVERVDSTATFTDIISIFKTVKCTQVYLLKTMTQYSTQFSHRKPIWREAREEAALKIENLLQKPYWALNFKGSQKHRDFKVLWNDCLYLSFMLRQVGDRLRGKRKEDFRDKKSYLLKIFANLKENFDVSTGKEKQKVKQMMKSLKREIAMNTSSRF